MTKKKKNTVRQFFLKALLAAPLLLSFVNNVMSLIRLEASLAGKKMIIILVLSVMAAFLIATTWLGLLLILHSYFVAMLHWSEISSLSVLVLLNFFLFLVTILIIAKMKKNLFFPKLRKSLSRKNNNS